MLKFIVKRTLAVIPTLLLVLVIVFFMLHIIGGSPVYSMVDLSDISREELDELNAKYGFDRPIYVQFWEYFTGILSGNWGVSYFDGQDVFDNMMSKMEPTIMITIYSTLITVLIGVPVGVIAATHRNSWLDYTLSSASMVFLTVPTFWLGLLMVYFLALKLKLFPIQGYIKIADGGFWKAVWSVTMPSFALGMTHVANLARNTRSAMLDVISEDYIRTAKAKGLPVRKIRYKHALKATLAIVTTLIANSIVGMLGGSVVVENVFNIDGVGRYAYNALMRRDYPQEQAILLFMAFLYMITNILMDIVYKLIDPRVEYN